MTYTPMKMTHNQDFYIFYNKVNRVHPPQVNQNNTRININKDYCGRGRVYILDTEDD